MAFSPNTAWQIEAEKVESVTVFFPWALKSLRSDTTAMKLKDAYSLEGKI